MTPPPGTRPAERMLWQLCDVTAAIGGGVLILIACMTTVSVIGRAFFAHPIFGDIELVQLGAAVVVTMFMPYTQIHRANIMVDFFTQNARPATRRWMDFAGCALYTLVLALILWRVAVGGIAMHAAGERTMLMDLPLWLPYLLMLPGLALCCLIGAVQCAGHFGARTEPRA
ncbi:MAG: TRAP transporter small permease [Candidatus Dactylopiibacterium sp.]|nr:TRAP transporter small permease [Candidatus Dactylopiibacterium sp.]